MNKPNVIFLIQDQMQQQVITEQSACLMPNLRLLMKDGVEFERAYSSNAICSPSRASLLTATLPHVHGMVDCTHTVPPYRAEFDDSLDTMTQAFCDEGYQVSYYGKWHIERTHQLEKFGIHTYETERDIPGFPVTVTDRVIVNHNPGYPEKMVCGIFSEDATFTEEYYIYEKAIAEIEQQRQVSKPFCTFISTYAPHDPYCVPEEIYDLYENVPLSLPTSFNDPMTDKPSIYRRMRVALSGLSEADYQKALRCYYSYCTLVDIQIGKLITYLREHDIYNNTMIVCLSDHGDMMGAHGLMMKSVEPFEEIYHIPLVMKLPYQQAAGTTVDFYINNYEIAPTVLELVGCRCLRGDRIGVSMVPWLKGKKMDKHYGFAEFFGQRYSFTQRIYWEDNLKYVFNAFSEDELYDLTVDPDELTNQNRNLAYRNKRDYLCGRMWEKVKESGDESLMDAEYFLLQIAPVGPGEKMQRDDYSIYNKRF